MTDPTRIDPALPPPEYARQLRARYDPQHHAYTALADARQAGVSVLFAAPSPAQPHRAVHIEFHPDTGFSATELEVIPSSAPTTDSVNTAGPPVRTVGSYRLHGGNQLDEVIEELRNGPSPAAGPLRRQFPVTVPVEQTATLTEFLDTLDHRLAQVQDAGSLDALLAAYQRLTLDTQELVESDPALPPTLRWEHQDLLHELDQRIVRTAYGHPLIDETNTGAIDHRPQTGEEHFPSPGLDGTPVDTALAHQLDNALETAIRRRFDPTYPQWQALHDTETRGVWVEFAAPTQENPGRHVTISYRGDLGQWRATEYQREHNDWGHISSFTGDYIVGSGINPWLSEFLDALDVGPVLSDPVTGDPVTQPGVRVPDPERAALWQYATEVAEHAHLLDTARNPATLQAARQDLATATAEPGHSIHWTRIHTQILDEFTGYLADHNTFTNIGAPTTTRETTALTAPSTQRDPGAVTTAVPSTTSAAVINSPGTRTSRRQPPVAPAPRRHL